MKDNKSISDALRAFVQEHGDSLAQWVALSLAVTVALNLLWILTPILPLIAVIILPIGAWQYYEWKRRKEWERKP